MSAQELKELFQVFGWPVLSIIGAGWFLAAKVWPWYTDRVKLLDARTEKQTDAFLSGITSSHEAMAIMLTQQREHFDATMAQLTHNRETYTVGLAGVHARLDDLGRRLPAVKHDPAEVP